MPLDVLVAMTEGSLGYFLQQAMLNELRRREVPPPCTVFMRPSSNLSNSVAGSGSVTSA